MSEETKTAKPWTGVTCRILRVDLSTGKTWVEERDDRYYRKWIGGSGRRLPRLGPSSHRSSRSGRTHSPTA